MNKGHVKDFYMSSTYEPIDDVYHCMKSSEKSHTHLPWTIDITRQICIPKVLMDKRLQMEEKV